MEKRPLILLSPSIEKRGVEFNDNSASLSIRYNSAVIAGGGIPVTIPTTIDRRIIAEAVRRTEGVLLTGGDDINPDLYNPKLPRKIRKTIEQTPDGGARDMRELLLIEEVFRQKKPLLAICRGAQMLQVAFGGQLLADIPQQQPSRVNHRRLDAPLELVHEVALTPGSLVSKICKTSVLGVNSTHHQGILEPAEPLVATGKAPDGMVEVMELRAPLLPFFLAVQFHPERLLHKHVRYKNIFRSFVAACGKK